MRRALVLLLLVVLPLSAQQPYIESFEVRLHNLDVVVTDGEGNPVRGLTKGDFIVTENGVVKEISNFATYDSRTSVVSATSPATGADAAASTPPPPRRYVFFIDELGVQKAARERLYTNVAQLVQTMREGDLATVVRPTLTEKVVQEFTGDRAAIERALKKAIDESLPGEYGQTRELRELQRALATANVPNEIKFAKRAYADAAKRRVEHRLGQIRALANALAGVQGRKALILVTMGLTTKPGSEAWDYIEQLRSIEPGEDPAERVEGPGGLLADFEKEINDIAYTAAANGVTIYALEPDIPLHVGTAGRAEIKTAERKDESFGNDRRLELPRHFQKDLLHNSEMTYASLTEKTGGRWFRGIDTIDDTFRQVSEDLSFYYSLAYRVSGEEDKPQRVAVQVRNRPELRVRTRAEVLEKSTPKEMEDLVVASLLYPRDVNELGMTATAGTPKPNRGFYEIPIDIVIPMKNLAFMPAGEGDKYVATFTLYFAAAGQRSDFASGGQQSQQIEITGEQYQQIDSVNYRYKTGIEVAPGNMRIALGVIDSTSRLTGFRTVEVMAQ